MHILIIVAVAFFVWLGATIGMDVAGIERFRPWFPGFLAVVAGFAASAYLKSRTPKEKVGPTARYDWSNKG